MISFHTEADLLVQTSYNIVGHDATVVWTDAQSFCALRGVQLFFTVVH